MKEVVYKGEERYVIRDHQFLVITNEETIITSIPKWVLQENNKVKLYVPNYCCVIGSKQVCKILSRLDNRK